MKRLQAVFINDRFYKGLAIAIREVQNATFSQGILMLFAIAFPCIFHIWGSHDPRRQPTVPVAEVHICSGKVSFSEGGGYYMPEHIGSIRHDFQKSFIHKVLRT